MKLPYRPELDVQTEGRDIIITIGRKSGAAAKFSTIRLLPQDAVWLARTILATVAQRDAERPAPAFARMPSTPAQLFEAMRDLLEGHLESCHRCAQPVPRSLVAGRDRKGEWVCEGCQAAAEGGQDV